MYNLYISITGHGPEVFLGRYSNVLEIVIAAYALVDYDDFTFCIDPCALYFRPRGVASDFMYNHLSEKILDFHLTQKNMEVENDVY